MRGATLVDARDDVLALISTRAPLAGSDTPSSTASRSRFDFNPRSPCGERRRPPWFRRPTVCYFNPRSPCGERRTPSATSATAATISIRAPLAGSDLDSSSPETATFEFQSALPLRGATCCARVGIAGLRFQSALPLRGATCPFFRYRFNGYFNPRSPCGERPSPVAKRCCSTRFQSALPLRGATRAMRHCYKVSSYFNPRSPCGERQSPRYTAYSSHYFNPRSPCGERPLHFVASIYYQQSVVFSKTVTANSVDKLRKTTAKSAITRCEPHS